MDAVIERLRASKDRQLEELFQEGVICGRFWAEKTAEYLDLQILQNSSASQEDCLDERFLTSLFDVEHDDFWEEVLDEQWRNKLYPETQYGFIRGALEIWSEVEQKL